MTSLRCTLLSFSGALGSVSGHQRLKCNAGVPSYVRGHRETVTRRLYLDSKPYPRTTTFIRGMYTILISLKHSGSR